MKTRIIEINEQEADLICAALIAFNYEDFSRSLPDINEKAAYVSFLTTNISLQDRIKEIFEMPNIKMIREKSVVKYKKPKMSRGRVR